MNDLTTKIIRAAIIIKKTMPDDTNRDPNGTPDPFNSSPAVLINKAVAYI